MGGGGGGEGGGGVLLWGSLIKVFKEKIISFTLSVKKDTDLIKMYFFLLKPLLQRCRENRNARLLMAFEWKVIERANSQLDRLFAG